MTAKQEKQTNIHLSEYAFVLVKHKWLIFSILFVIVSLTMFFTMKADPVYLASSTIIIESEKMKSPLTGEKLELQNYVSQTLAFNTHASLIKSNPVLTTVINKLELDKKDNIDFRQIHPVKRFFSQLKKNIQAIIGKQKESPAGPVDPGLEFISKLKEKINIQEIRDTLLLKVQVYDFNPVMAKNIANELADAYIKYNIANRLKSSQNTVTWMTDQLFETQQRLEKAEADFLAYKQKQKIFSVEGKQRQISQQIAEFNDAYLKTRNKRLELDAKLQELQKTLYSNGEIVRARSLIDNSLVDSLYAKQLESEVEFNRLSKVFKSKHPKIIQLEVEIEKTKKKIDEELKKEIENLKSERKILLNKESVLQTTIEDFENDALETNKKELQYTILERNVQTHRNLYDILLTKIKEANIEDNLDISNIRIAEDATVPKYPVKPQKKMNLMISIVIGLFSGIGFSFLLEYLDRTLNTESDVEKYIELPVLAVIPESEKI